MLYFLLAKNTLKVVSGNIVDFAGYGALTQTVTFTYGADTTAPTVSVKSATEKTITLAFSESVVDVDNANVRYRHTYNDSSYQVLGDAAGAVAVVADTDSKEWKITFASPMAPGSVMLYIGYVSDTSSATKIADKFGNKLEKASLTVNVVEDKTAPTVTSVAFVDSTHIDVTFSEGVSNADVISNYTLKNADDKTVAISGIVKQSGNTYRLTTAIMDGGSYNLTVGGNIEDTSLATNDLVAVTLNVAINDKVDPSVSAVVINKAALTDADKLRVYFSEAMSDTGLTSKSSYYLKVNGGAATELPTGTTITKVSSKIVEIVFPNAISSLNADGGDVLAISGQLKDLAGNDIGGLVSDVTIGVDAVTVVAKSAKALDKRTIEFRVDKVVKSVDASKFDEDVAGGIAVASVTAANDLVKQEGIITVKLTADMATNVTGTAFNIAVADGGITTQLGYSGTVLANAVTQATAKDYIKPVLSSVTTADADADGQIDQIVVAYSENIQQTSVSASDYTVEGYTIKDVAVSTTDVTIKLTESGVADTSKKPKVTQTGEVADDSAQHNVLGAQVAKTSDDGAAPVLLSAILTNGAYAAAGDTAVFTFSESVTSGAAFNNAAFVANIGKGAGGEGAITLTGDTVNDINATPSVTITVTEVGASGGLALTDVVNAIDAGTGIVDAAGNELVDNATDVEVN